MASAVHRRRRRGRWRRVAAVPAVALLVVSAAVPLRAATPVAQVVAERPVAIVEKKAREKKKSKKKHKKAETIPEMIEDVFGKRADEALRIAHCESKYRPDAVSYAGAVGVFQIRPRLHGWRVKRVKGGKDLRDPRTNIRVAYSLMKDQGWTPWVCAGVLGITRSRTRSVSYTTTSRNEGRPREPRRLRMAP